MRAVYTDQSKMWVRFEIGEGETFTSFAGPQTVSIPVNEASLEYNELLALDIDIEDPVVTPVFANISARQFFQQLANDKVITEQEAEETAEGKLPALLLGAINQLPEAARFPARMMARRATEFSRTEQLVTVIATILEWDDARLDKLWSDASKL